MAQELATDKHSIEKAFPLLTPEQRETIMPFLTWLPFAPDKPILEQGVKGKTMYFIEAGTVRFFTHDVEGNELDIRKLGQGDFFGEIALLTGEERSVTAQAVDEVRVWELHELHFDKFMHHCPEMVKAMMVEMAHRLQTSAELFADVKQLIEKKRTRAERNTQKVVGMMGTLWFAGLNLVVIAAWILFNRMVPHPPDNREFAGLGLFAACEALIVTLLVLAKQNRDEQENNLRTDTIIRTLKGVEQKLLKEEKKIEAEVQDK